MINKGSGGLGGTMIKPLANGSTASITCMLNDVSDLKDIQSKPNFVTTISGDVMLKGQIRRDNRYG